MRWPNMSDPALEMDGTLLEVLDVTDGVARIRLNGVCGSYQFHHDGRQRH